MARNKKLQRAEKLAVAQAAPVKPVAVEVVKKVEEVAPPPPPPPEPPKVKLPKVRPPRNPKRTPVKNAPLVRGTTKSARLMSSIVANTIAVPEDKTGRK
ncbi:MAG: hypothetical protein U0746_17405 [Gemmataceae bacterium]